MIQITNLSFSFGETPLYEGVTFNIGENQKIGLVGSNGSGKTTLLNIIAGKEKETNGKIKVIGKVGIVPQEIKHDPEMEKAKNVRGFVDPDDSHGDHELKKLFSGLELTLELNDKPQKLSGGQKTKLALAKALLAAPDILLLDEPTNFMDVSGKKWVMNFLANYPKTVIVISHDLSLMNHAIDKILFVNSLSKTIDEYKGNYSKFEKLKKEKDELQKRQAVQGMKQVKRMEEAVKHAMSLRSEKGVRVRVQLQKRLAKMKETLPELPQEVRKIKIRLPDPANIGEVVIKAESVKKSYGENEVLKDVSLTIYRGERIALIGPNGAGKSTFIKTLMGILKPDSGTITKNSDLDIGYYSQEFETFDMNKKVIDTFTDITHLNEGICRAYLGRYMFSGDKIYQRIETLSGGEKTRLSIALLTAKNHNLLILDEPTTYLDVLSQRIILEALKEYKGAMLIVSHTPEFVIELAPKRAYLFPEEKTMFWENSLVQKVEEI
ncbi:MAG TPA: ABC-F family ATP-binding cassette domain-containing protein [Candidatus Saccharimonadales bacterium]|nr:ABC-F family ATP-binding cassette domain-containing protein [Candidatus Saccharimonadales bacterium]